jgi:hypothetical protein
MDPDPGGPKTCGSGSPTLILTLSKNEKLTLYYNRCGNLKLIEKG